MGMGTEGVPKGAKNLVDNARAKIVHALTAYDRRQAGHKGYNPYALGQYFQAVERTFEDEGVKAGEGLRGSILRNFCGKVADVCLKAVGESPATVEELRG